VNDKIYNHFKAIGSLARFAHSKRKYINPQQVNNMHL